MKRPHFINFTQVFIFMCKTHTLLAADCQFYFVIFYFKGDDYFKVIKNKWSFEENFPVLSFLK